MPDDTSYRLRLPVALASSATIPVLIGIFLALQIRPVWAGIVLGLVVALAGTALTVQRVRRRTLTLRDDALVVQRDRYRLVVPWSGVTGVRRRRHQLVMEVEELLCTDTVVEAVDSRGLESRLPKGLTGHPALSRVMVSLYDDDWRSGPIGERLRAHGVKL